MARLLVNLGATVEGLGTTTLRVRCETIISDEPDAALVGRIRGSVLLLGPSPDAAAIARLALVLLLADLGIAVVGTLVGALAVQTQARDLLVPLLALPLLIPVVIGVAKATTPLFLAAGAGAVPVRWLAVLGLYDLVFGLLAYALFDYLVED